MSDNGNKIRIAGLWQQEGRDGSPYYSGSFGFGAKLMLFKNSFKKSEKDPDLVLYIAKTEPKPAAQPVRKDNDLPF